MPEEQPQGARGWREITCITVLVLLVLALANTGLRKGGAWDPRRFNDFAAYHMSAEAALEGRLHEAYHDTRRPYQYPPTLAALIAPIGHLSYRGGLFIWVLGKALLLAWLLRALPKLITPAPRPLDVLLAFVFCYRFLDSDFANGNANLLCLGVVVAGIVLLRRGKRAAGGFVLALAACIKATPLLFLPWLLLQRRWRQAGGFCLGLVLWGAVAPVAILGSSDYQRCCSTWYEQLLAPMSPLEDRSFDEAPQGYIPGQSLRAMSHRLTLEIDASAHDDRSITINLVDGSPQLANTIYVGLALALLAVTFYTYRRRRTVGSLAELSSIFVLSAVISPLSRKAAFVALLPAAFQARVAVSNSTRHRKVLEALWWTGFACAALTAPAVVGRETATLLVSYCPATIAGVCLVAILWIAKAGEDSAEVAALEGGFGDGDGGQGDGGAGDEEQGAKGTKPDAS
ncbi:MAG: glycosyltransferase family 87 protein [Planctomycetota bacterium]